MPRRANLILASGSALLGSSIAFFNMFDWSQIQESMVGNPSSASRVLDFFAAQAVATALVVLSLYELYRIVLSRRGTDSRSLLSVMGDALSSRRAVRLGAAIAVAYAVLYSFVSSFVVYQPTVDFATTYGVTQPGWSYSACCGDAGSIPSISLYVAPSLHLGVELVPLTFLFVFLIPLLVGFNSILSFYAFRVSSFPVRGRWLASSGAVIGLFTACPTCAGLFLAGSLGAAGTTLAVALAPYQLLFIGITIPVLAVAPILTAMSVKRSYEASCRVPTAVSGAKINTR